MTARRSIVIFDMDGTLTRPMLDFDAIRREIGLEREPLLEAVERMTGAERERAEAILHRHEDAAAAESELQPRAAEVVATIRAAGVPAVLMTRNRRASTDTFQRRHGLEFDQVWTRENGVNKPSPEPVLAICERFGAAPADAWVVGDFHYDILCGKAAGARTVLLLDGAAPRPDWAAEADHVIHRLTELLSLMGLGGDHAPTPAADS